MLKMIKILSNALHKNHKIEKILPVAEERRNPLRDNAIGGIRSRLKGLAFRLSHICPVEDKSARSLSTRCPKMGRKKNFKRTSYSAIDFGFGYINRYQLLIPNLRLSEEHRRAEGPRL